jgi:hypothetical protein
MKKNLMYLAVAAIALTSCGGGFKQGPGGMLYNIHEDKSGPTIKEGDFISVNLIAKTEVRFGVNQFIYYRQANPYLNCQNRNLKVMLLLLYKC